MAPEGFPVAGAARKRAVEKRVRKGLFQARIEEGANKVSRCREGRGKGTLEKYIRAPVHQGAMRFRKLTIIKAPSPGGDVNTQLQWLGGSLGLFNERDKDRSCFRIFITLLKNAHTGSELSSDDLAEKTGLSRGTVVHHLNKLMGAGLVETYRSRYVLRVDNLEELIAKIEEDLQKTVETLKQVASDIDRKLGL